MKVLEFVRKLDELAETREPFAVATVVGIEGSSIGKPGFKAIVSKDGHIVYGTLGGVCPESAISSFALRAIKTGQARIVNVYLENAERAVASILGTPGEDDVHVETNCGGMMRIYIEPYLPADRLIIVSSGGRDGLEDALVRLGKHLEFEVVVIDPEATLGQPPDVLIAEKDYDLTKFPFIEADSVVILTHSAKDVPILTLLSTKNVRYVGLMGSRDRARGELSFLLKRGVPKEFVDSVKSPVGADIGAKSSWEIAVSIMAEVISVKRGRPLPRSWLAPEAASPELVAEGRETTGQRR